MKKLLLLIALMLCVGAMWNEADARYNLGGRKAYNEIKVGDTIAIQGISDNANNGYRYICETSLQTAFTEGCVFTVEEGPADIRTGKPTVFLFNLAKQKYFGINGLRGQRHPGSLSHKLVSTPDSAYNFELQCAADSSVAWNGQQNFDASSTVFCYSYADGGEQVYGFICNWGYFDADQIRFWGYHDTNPWDVYSVYETKDASGELQDLIDYYESLNLEFTAGTDPGYYPAELSAAYDKALSEAILAVMETHTDDEYRQYAENLKNAKEAVENAYIDITDGYYYIVSAYPEFLNKQRVEMGCYMDNTNNYINWKALDTKAPEFIFHLSRTSDGNVQVQSYNTDLYWSAASAQSSSQGILTTTTPKYNQVFNCIGSGQWQIWNTYYNQHYHPESNGAGSGKNGKLVTWNSSGKGSSSTWYVRAISDPALIDSLDAVKAQNKLTAELQSSIGTATTAYDKLFVYALDTNQPLITHVTDGDPDDCQLSSNASDPSEGQHLSYLIDGDPASFWHSSYHATDDPKTYHYLQADISNNPQKSFQIYIRRRDGSYGNYDRPTAVNIYATADTTGQWNNTASWKLVRNLPNLPTSSDVYDYYTPGIDLDFEASYIRFEVLEKSNYPSRNLNGYPYFNLAEFQIYPVSLDENASQYFYIPGMKDAADALNALMTEARAKVAANTATQEDIDALKAATKAVNELFADTTALKSLITSCTTLAETIEVGEGIGQIPSADKVTALIAAIDEAKKFNTGGGKLDKEALDATYNALKAARLEFLNALNVPSPDKWYYLVNLDASRDENPDLYTKGAVMYMDDYGTDKQLRWDLNDDEHLSYNPMAMWHFIPVEDENYALTFYIQNLGTGLYMGDYPTYSVPVVSVKEPVLYQINISGGQPGLIARKGENPGYSLHAANSGKTVVGWSAGANTASAWDIVEVDPTYVDAITLTIHNNNIDVFAVPYEYADLAEINEGVHTYAIKKMTLNKETNETTIELYEKNEFEAGEPCILVTGDPTDPEAEDEDMTLVIATPTKIAQQMTPANGMVGLLTTEKIPLGAAWFTGKDISNAEASISAHTGYIDATLYKGEVEGVETAMTLTITGLNWPTEDPTTTGDVNEDGVINAADVVAIYNYITDGAASGINAKLADVNEDSAVSAADVVAIYAIISGETIKSNSYVEANIIEDGDNTVARLTAAIGNSDDLTAVPVTIFLNNSIDIVAAEYVVVAPVEPAKFVFDEEEDDYMINNTDRWSKGHNAVMIPGTDLHGQDGFFVSITDSKNRAFAGNEGSVATVYFDATGLADGEYEVTIKDGIAITKATDTYKTADMTLKFVVAGGKATGLSTITAEQIAAAKSIITLDGKAVVSPVKGNIYVVDGAVVKY